MKIFLMVLIAVTAAQGADYQLKAGPTTVAWGYYWSAAKLISMLTSGPQ